MKRGGQLKRTEIKRGAPIPQRMSGLKPGNPLVRRTELGRGTKRLERSTPLARKTELDSAAKAPRKRPRYTGPPRKTKDKLAERSGGVCEYCGVREATEAHHRLGRKAGGTKRPWINKLSNLVHLDLWCHARITNTNGNRAEYEEAGFLLREGLPPATTPLDHARLGRVLLLDNGETKPAPKRKKAAA